MKNLISILAVIVIIASCKKSSTSTPTSNVTIGTQVWMLKNLDVSTYKNGDPIPQVTDPAAWAALTTGAWCWYNNDPTNGTTYGKLYNWYAVNNPRGIAPAGYHIPSDAEWTTLSMYLGGFAVAGAKMKETGTTHWASPNTGATNSSGFTGLPGGVRNLYGAFSRITLDGAWFSSTALDTQSSMARWLNYDDGEFDQTYTFKKTGLYVRCLKD